MKTLVLKAWLILSSLLPLCVFAQSASTLEQSVTWTLETTPLPTALQLLAEREQVRLSYNPKLLPADHQVNIREAIPIQSLLTQWLKGTGLTFSLIEQQIAIYPSPSSDESKLETNGRWSVNGYVLEAESREPLPYASVRLLGSQQGAIANQYGYFVLSLPKNMAEVQVEVRHLGHQAQFVRLTRSTPLPLTVDLSPNALKLDSIEIVEEIAPMQAAGPTYLGQAYLQSVPTFLGERDAIKSLQYLPGVQRGNDGNSSLYVRGGNGDQNLILLDEAPVYNVNHLFGFFSVFNGDAIQSMEFWKGGFPAHYGGRLSSVVSITTREGSREKWQGQGAIGITSARVTVDGPIFNKKGSLLLSARRSYWDVLVRPFLDVAQANSKPFFFFHGYQAKLTYDLSPKNKLYASLYNSRDRYGVNEISDRQDGDRFKTGFAWQNLTASLRWNHLASERWFVNTSIFATSYGVNLFNRSVDSNSRGRGVQRLAKGSQMQDVAVKSDLYFYPEGKHRIRAGAIAYQHWFTPNRVRAFRENFNNALDNEDIDLKTTERYPTQELAAYVSDSWQNARWKWKAGFRWSAYQAQGKWEHTPEPRLSGSFLLNRKHTLSISGTRMAQYIHQISNSGLALPIDVWIPSTNQILPQRSWQATLGWEYQHPDQGLRLVAETYYKTMDRVVGYRDGGSFFNLDLYNLDLRPLDWQQLVIQGHGESYGLELSANLQRNGHQALVSYSWSRTLYQFEELNQGTPFAPRFDRRHTLSVLYQYEFSSKWKAHLGWFFSTGNPIPLPLGETILAGHEENIRFLGPEIPTSYLEFSAPDAFRTALYHRLDASIKYTPTPKRKRRWKSHWELGAFNVYNRLNPTFFLLERDFDEAAGTELLRLQKNSLFFFTPSVSYLFSF
ncbi:MAG: carboxypeptidase-like regulatory domain-containing protein [Bacteroidota bacterium]